MVLSPEIEQKIEGSSQSSIPKENGKSTITEYQKGGGWAAFPFIIGCMMGLSLAASAWSSNLVVYLVKVFNVKSIDATQINNVILGCNTLLPLAGAILADVFFQPYFVISFSAFLSLLGIILFTLITTSHTLRPSPCEVVMGSFQCPTPSKLQLAMLYITFALASLGVGGTRFTLATMGADQFEAKYQRAFFSLYFVFFYVANGTSLTAIIYIEDNVGWGLAFGICVVAIAIALVLFLSGKRFYRRKPKVERNPLVSIVRVAIAAVQKRNLSGTFGNRNYYYGSVETKNILRNGPSTSLRFLNCAALKIEGDHLDQHPSKPNARSWKLCTVEEVEDLKTLLKIMPLWSSGFLLSTTISLLNNLVILQVLTMDRHLGPHFNVSAGSFIVFNIVSVALSILIIDFVICPIWVKFFPNWTLTPLPRIGIGHIINILGLVVSALIEMRRLHVVQKHQQLMNQPGYIVPMTALWLVVPLVVLGIAEGFHFPGYFTFFYQEFPKSLKNSSGAMVASVLGIGYYLTIAMTDLIRKTTSWLPDNINDGRLDKVYWTLAVIGVANFGYYLICAFKYHRMEKPNHDPGALAHPTQGEISSLG